MATITIGFLGTFREFGLSAAAIQAPVLSHQDRDALFWFNFIFAIGVTVIVLICAPVVARFYREPAVETLLRLAAVGFFISGLSTQHNALLRRSLSFGSIFVADVGGLLLGSIVAILSAAYHPAATSIIAGGIAQSLFTTCATIAFGGWWPSRPTDLRSRLGHAVFGANVSLFSALNFVTNNIGSIVLGKWFDAASMGFFSRAQNLYSLPSNFILSPFLQVQFPLLCRALNDGQKTREIYQNVLLLTGVTFIPAGCLLPFVAVDLTKIILGPQWAYAGVILAWFSPAMIALGLVAPFGQYMTSQGRVRELSMWGLGDILIRGGGAFVGALFGPEYAAAGFSLATLTVAAPILVWITVRRGPFRIGDYVRAGYPGVLLGLLVFLVALAIELGLGAGHSFLSISLAGIVWVAGILLLPKTRALLRSPFQRI